MAWTTISGAIATTATIFGGDVMNKINNMFNGVDVSDTVTIHANVDWNFNSEVTIFDHMIFDGIVAPGIGPVGTARLYYDDAAQDMMFHNDDLSAPYTWAKTFADLADGVGASDNRLLISSADPIPNHYLQLLSTGDISHSLDSPPTQITWAISSNVIVNADVNSSAAIAGSKINMASTQLSDTANIMLLDAVQTVTGAKTFLDDKLLIQNPAATFEYTLTGGAIAADRILNLPVITGTDTLMSLGLPQTVSGRKTFDTNSLSSDNMFTKAGGTTFRFANAEVSPQEMVFDWSAVTAFFQFTIAATDGELDFVDNGIASTTANPSATGMVRAANAEVILGMRDSENTFDYQFLLNATEQFTLTSTDVTNGEIRLRMENADTALVDDDVVATFVGSATTTGAPAVRSFAEWKITAVTADDATRNGRCGVGLPVAGTFDNNFWELDAETNRMNCRAGMKIGLDGLLTGDTYIHEVTANVIQFVQGGSALTFPTGVETVVGRATTDTLTNKTLTTPTIGSFTNATHDHEDAAGGGQVTATDALDATGTPTASNFLRGDNTWATPAGSGDMVLADVQTVTGAKTFADNAFLIQNPAITFEYLFQGGAIVADRTITLPVLTGNDTLVFEAHSQTLTNKTIDLASNTITGSKAEFNTALDDATDFGYVDTAQTWTQLQTFSNATLAIDLNGNAMDMHSVADRAKFKAVSGYLSLQVSDNLQNTGLVISIDGLINSTGDFALLNNAAAVSLDFKPLMRGLSHNSLTDGSHFFKIQGATKTDEDTGTVPILGLMGGRESTNAVTRPMVGIMKTDETVVTEWDVSGNVDFFSHNQSNMVLVAPALGTPTSGVMTNVTGLPTAGLVDNAVTLAKMAGGTDGNLITYDTAGDPAFVATGSATQVLTSNGAGTAPTFQAAGGGSQTPWTSNIDADGFDLNDLSNILFRTTTAAPESGDRAIWYEDTTGMNFNALTGDLYNFRVANVIEAQLTATNFNIFSNTLLLDTGTVIQWAGEADRKILNTTGGFEFEVETGDTFDFVIESGSPTLSIAAATITSLADLDMSGKNIDNINQLQIENTAATFTYNIIGSAIVANRQVTLPLLTSNDILVTQSFIQTLTNKTIDGDLNTIQDLAVTSLKDGTDGELITWSAAGVAETVAVGTATHVLTSNGVGLAPTFQAAAGGSQTPWVADIDADGFDLTDLSNIEFRTSTGAPAGTVQALYASALGIFYNVPSSDAHRFLVNSVAELVIDSSKIDFQGNNIENGGVIFLNEQASANADVANQGQIWVKTGDPNTLQFTNEEGTDYRINFSSSAQLSAMLSDETGTNVVVFNTSPTLVTPLLGTPTSGVLTNCTGLPSTTGLSDTADIAYLNTANTYTAGSKQLFQHTATTAGIRLLNSADTPSALAAGDLWITSGVFRIFHGAATHDIIINDTAQTLVSKTLTSPILTTPAIGTVASGTIDLGSVTVTGSVSEFNTALQSETFFFISNNISNMGTSTKAQFTTACSDGAFAYEGDANTWGAVNQNISTGGGWQEGGVDISPIGVHDIWMGAVGMWETTTAGCEPLTKTELGTNDVDIQTLDFDTAADEFAQFTMPLPDNFDNSTITFEVYWTAASGSGTVSWDIAALARSEGDPLDAAFTDETTVTDTLTTANDMHISPTSADMSLTGHVDGDYIHFRVRRDVSDDTLGVDAKLIGVKFHITTDAATAA